MPTEAEYLAYAQEFRAGDGWPPVQSLMGLELVRLTPTTIQSMELCDGVR
jgi:hypothetical protein